MTMLARLRFAEEKLSAAGVERMLAAMSPADQKILSGGILPVGRYPLTLNARLDMAIAAAVDPIHPVRVFRALGRRSAEINFDRYHTGLAAPDDPHVIISRIGAMRRLYYGEGEFSFEKLSPTSARVIIRGMSTVLTPDCESTAGFWEAAIARSGGHQVEVRHFCRLDGEPDCRFEFSWRK